MAGATEKMASAIEAAGLSADATLDATRSMSNWTRRLVIATVVLVMVTTLTGIANVAVQFRALGIQARSLDLQTRVLDIQARAKPPVYAPIITITPAPVTILPDPAPSVKR